MDGPTFEEGHAFYQTPLAAIMAGVWLFSTGVTYFAMAAAGSELAVPVTAFVALAEAAFFGAILCITLRTRVDSAGVAVTMWPFVRDRRIAHADIVSAEAVTYRPILEYGGWGFRYSLSHGWAYNIWGNRGVRFQLRDGGKLLIGSRRADEFARAIHEARTGARANTSPIVTS